MGLEWRSWIREGPQSCIELLRITLVEIQGEGPRGQEGTLGAVFLLWIIASPAPADWQRHQPSYPRAQTSQNPVTFVRSKALTVMCNLHNYNCGPGTGLVLQAAGETRPLEVLSNACNVSYLPSKVQKEG